MRRADVRKTDSSKLGRAKLIRRKGNQVAKPIEPVEKPAPVAKPKIKKTRKDK